MLMYAKDANGDISPVELDANGRVKVNLLDPGQQLSVNITGNMVNGSFKSYIHDPHVYLSITEAFGYISGGNGTFVAYTVPADTVFYLCDLTMMVTSTGTGYNTCTIQFLRSGGAVYHTIQLAVYQNREALLTKDYTFPVKMTAGEKIQFVTGLATVNGRLSVRGFTIP